MKSILDPRFKYTPSASTDVRKTWARHRKQQRDIAMAYDEATTENIARNLAEAQAVVRPIKKGRA